MFKYYFLLLLSFYTQLISAQVNSVTIPNTHVIDGYSAKSSYSLGETVVLHTKTPPFNPTYPLVFSDIAFGNYGFNITNVGNTQSSGNTSATYIDGLNYQANAFYNVPSSLPSFVYVSQPMLGGGQIPLIIKGDKSSVDVVIVYPTNTENAYCNFGGKSTYPYNSGVNNLPGVISPTVSFNRQILPNDNNTSQNALGFFKWIQSANRFGNNTVGFISDADLEDYTEIENAKLLIIIGHSEYWTRGARTNFDRFVDEGHNALILSGNTMWWQVRLQLDPNNSNNPQMVCNKYSTTNPFTPDHDDICDPLLETNNWNNQDLKYSTLSSIGSDWGIGGFSGDRKNQFGVPDPEFPLKGFSTQKVILSNSPIFNNVPLSFNGNLNSLVLDSYYDSQGEVDGVLASGVDANGNPILDREGMGFYKAELLTYDLATYRVANSGNDISPLPLPFNQPPFYTGIMAMQKTCTSGKIINVNCNQWCQEAVINTRADIQVTTQNMIDLLLSNGNIFSNQVSPSQFKITPSVNNVSYEACANGHIQITPCGVTITDGYKVDATSAPFHSKMINDCSSCNRGARLSNVSIEVVKNERAQIANQITLYPNPSNGILNIDWDLPKNKLIDIHIESINGQLLIAQNSISTIENHYQLKMLNLNAGIYVLKILDAENNDLIKVEKISVNP